MSRSDTALRYFEEHRGYTEERIAYGISQHRKGRGTVTSQQKRADVKVRTLKDSF